MIDLEKAKRLIKELRICCTPSSCGGCHRTGVPDCCNKLERDAADMIESLLEFIEAPRVHVALYDKEEIFENCRVQVLTNTVTGDVSIGFWPNREEEKC